MSATSADLIHVWNRCHGCGAAPIVGVRYECQVCPAGPDNDLCAACHALLAQGRLVHPKPGSRDLPPPPHPFKPFDGTPREGAAPWLAVPWVQAAAPSVPEQCVVRPEFRSGQESYFGSYGFVVAAQYGGPPLLITALHVMDELIRAKRIDASAANKSYTGRELPEAVAEVQLYDAFAPNWMIAELGVARGMLTLADARMQEPEPYSDRDIAAFRVMTKPPMRPLRLAAAPPPVGAPIFLAASPGRGARERTVPAVVVEVSERTFVFRFSPANAMPPFASGAPLIDRAGDVVAIMAGGGVLDGQQIGHANHVGNVRRHLGWRA